MIKSKWPLEVEFMSKLAWNGYVMLLEGVSNDFQPLDQMLEWLLNLF